MIFQTLKTWRLSFGWCWLLWGATFEKGMKKLNIPYNGSIDILEVGASTHSAVACSAAAHYSNCKLTLGYYREEEKIGLLALAQKALARRDIQSIVSYVDIKNIKCQYDLIVIKSVLGGVVRHDIDPVLSANDIIKKVMKNNLKPNGALITLDNGRGLLYSLNKRYGAGKVGWYYFEKGDLLESDHEIISGKLSSFSLKIRFGLIGEVVDCLFNLVDLFFVSEKMRSGCIILNVYSNKHKKDK